MGPIEEALREICVPALFGGKEIDADFWEILVRSVKNGGLYIPDHQLSVDSEYNTSKVASGELVESILGGSAINYVGHMACIREESAGARKYRNRVEMADLDRQNKISGGQERNCLHRKKRNWAWCSAVTHRLNNTELSQEEFQYNLRLRYSLMPQKNPLTCNGCGKRFLIKHTIS